jgi:hypothetical protein
MQFRHPPIFTGRWARVLNLSLLASFVALQRPAKPQPSVGTLATRVAQMGPQIPLASPGDYLRQPETRITGWSSDQTTAKNYGFRPALTAADHQSPSSFTGPFGHIGHDAGVRHAKVPDAEDSQPRIDDVADPAGAGVVIHG